MNPKDIRHECKTAVTGLDQDMPLSLNIVLRLQIVKVIVAKAPDETIRIIIGIIVSNFLHVLAISLLI